MMILDESLSLFYRKVKSSLLGIYKSSLMCLYEKDLGNQTFFLKNY